MTPLGTDAPTSAWRAQLDAALALAERWWPISQSWAAPGPPPGARVTSGLLPMTEGKPWRAWRCEADLAMPLASAAWLFGRDALGLLGRWSREFAGGEPLRTLWDDPDDAAWIVAVRYRTPPPLRDRGYCYAARAKSVEGAVWVVYDAATAPAPAPPTLQGTARATLRATAYRLSPAADGAGTRMEHLLVTDLGGWLPRWVQNHALSGPVTEAQRRDLAALCALRAADLRALPGGAP